MKLPVYNCICGVNSCVLIGGSQYWCVGVFDLIGARRRRRKFWCNKAGSDFLMHSISMETD